MVQEVMRNIDRENVVSRGGNKSGVQANMKDAKEAEVGASEEENKVDTGGKKTRLNDLRGVEMKFKILDKLVVYGRLTLM